MRNDTAKIVLNPIPDGFGFIYGQAWRGEDHDTINVMPPKRHWQGQFMLESYVPHDTDWVFDVDGEEVGLMSEQPNILDQFTKLLR